MNDNKDSAQSQVPTLSAACGAWRDLSGDPAHSYCTGRVSLPAPQDRCGCTCHTVINPLGRTHTALMDEFTAMRRRADEFVAAIGRGATDGT